MLAAGCGDGGHKPGTASGSGTAKDTLAQLDGYAQCMPTHGVPGFYLSTQTTSPRAALRC